MGEIKIHQNLNLKISGEKNCLADGNLNRLVNFPCNIPYSYIYLAVE
jgi:hypothetical protein